MKNTENLDPETWKKILKFAIAILAAIASAIGGASAHAAGLL